MSFKKFIKEDWNRVEYWSKVFQAAPTKEKEESLKRALNTYIDTINAIESKKHLKK